MKPKMEFDRRNGRLSVTVPIELRDVEVLVYDDSPHAYLQFWPIQPIDGLDGLPEALIWLAEAKYGKSIRAVEVLKYDDGYSQIRVAAVEGKTLREAVEELRVAVHEMNSRVLEVDAPHDGPSSMPAINHFDEKFVEVRFSDMLSEGWQNASRKTRAAKTDALKRGKKLKVVLSAKDVHVPPAQAGLADVRHSRSPIEHADVAVVRHEDRDYVLKSSESLHVRRKPWES